MATTELRINIGGASPTNSIGQMNQYHAPQRTGSSGKAFAILRICRLPDYASIICSAQHAFRERDTPNANPEALGLNRIEGAASSSAVKTAIEKRIKELDEAQVHGVKCVEYLISASPDAINRMIDFEADCYFDDALKWIKQKHGDKNVVSSVVHNDEMTPHMSVFVVPVVQREACTRKRSVGVKGGGREIREYPVPARSELSAKHHFGTREKLVQLQTDFAEQVGNNYGLKRGIHRPIGNERVTHTTIKEWYATIPLLLKDIESQKAYLDAEQARLERDRILLDAEKTDLLKIQSQVTSRLKSVQLELDKRESVLNDRAAALDRREVIVENGVTAKLADLNSRIATFNQERAVFREEMSPLQGYAPGQVIDFTTAMKQANIKPIPKGKNR